MKYWKCKVCGGKIRTSLSRMVNKNYNLNEKGDPIGKCLGEFKGEIESQNFYCSKCKKWYESETKLEDIAEFK